MDKVQTLNYAAQALEQFQASLPFVRKDMPGIRAAHETVLALLRESVKFLLPNRAELVGMSELRQVHVDMARLPFPVVALEAPWVWPDGEGGDKSGRIRSSKRIALCMTMTPELALKLPDTATFLDEPHGGVVVIALYWDDGAKVWRLPMGGVFVPHHNEVSDYEPREACLETRLLSEDYVKAGMALSQLRQFQVAPFVLLPEMFLDAISHAPRAEVRASIVRDSREEVAMLLQTGVVLNCANVTTVEIAAPKLLNKKRMKKGKQPFFSYQVLQVSAPRSTDGAGGAGQHASPRAHLRRGHIRRLKERTVWVRPALVNAGASASVGVVQKDYTIRPLAPD